jgi:HAD superfamily 5'-nucleotidase-like hydrolase
MSSSDKVPGCLMASLILLCSATTTYAFVHPWMAHNKLLEKTGNQSFRQNQRRIQSQLYDVDSSDSFTGTASLGNTNGDDLDVEDLFPPCQVSVDGEDVQGSFEHLCLPRHESNESVNEILTVTEATLQNLRAQLTQNNDDDGVIEEDDLNDDSIEETGRVYSNSYVDLGRVDTVGFDYDYTLVTYTDELLELIYDMALNRLVQEKQYPLEMLDENMKFDPKYSIRGLAVDRQTAWICHLSYTHKVAVAWEGREKVSRQRLMAEYTGKRALLPKERKIRLKPLNDLFSMAECCLIADTVQFFKDKNIPFCARNAVDDILSVIGSTHISGDFHRIVAANPEKYFVPKRTLRPVLEKLKKSGKRLIFVSNSPFWYVDAGMRYILGDEWRDMWDVCIVSAGKPRFYTDNSRPFREVSKSSGRVKFKNIEKFEPGEVYTEGCLRELTKCIDWNFVPSNDVSENDLVSQTAGGGGSLISPNVLYIGDSLFADLVDAKREFGWTTAAITPELDFERQMQSKNEYILAQQTIALLLNALRMIQETLGSDERTDNDLALMDALERMISGWRDEQANLLENPFGSVFRARHTPSLFAHSLRRYCDLYMSDVSALANYSPQHRFYPHEAKVLSHEITGERSECWDLEEILNTEFSPLN